MNEEKLTVQPRLHTEVTPDVAQQVICFENTHRATKRIIWRPTDGVPEKPIISGTERTSRGGIVGGIDSSYYSEMIRRIYREHRRVIHPRTHEFIVGATDDSNPKPYHKVLRQLHQQIYVVENGKLVPTGVTESVPYGHLGAFPCVAYHQLTNAVQVSGKFVVLPRSSTERCNPTDISKLNYKLVGELKYKATSQYKTKWNTRFQRRKR